MNRWKYTPEDDRKEGRQPGWKTSTAGCVQLGEKDLADFARVVGVGDHVTVMEKPLAPPPPKPPQVNMRPVQPLSF